LASTAVSSQFINGIMSRSIKEKKASGQVLLLDCCHSGSFAQPGVKGSQTTPIEDKFPQGRGTVVLTSSRAAQRSYEEKEADEEGLRLSHFTRALVQGLKTGEADIDGDGLISSVDLYQYVYQRIGKEKPEQTPQQWDLATEGQIIIAKNPHAIKDPWRETRQYVPSGFKVLDQKFFDNENKTPEAQILKLRVATWSLIIHGNYIERDGQDEALNIAKKIAEYPGISLMLIRGEPGAGKTAIMRWLVYQLFLQGHLILEKTQSENPDWREQLEEFSEKIGKKHFYVIADDLFRQCELEEAQSHFPFTLIGTTRFNEDKHENLDGLGYEIKTWDVKLPNQEEKKRIIAKVCEDETVKRTLDSKTKKEREELMNDAPMLVLMLQLSEGKPFDLIIADVIKRLPSEERYPVYEVFGVICSFYQYGITAPPEVLPLCLPEYSKKAVQNVVEFAIDAELKGLVNLVSKGGFEGLATIHELIAKTAMTERNRRNKGENQPYSSTCLEEYLRAAIQAIDATNKTHKRWACHGLKLLAVNDQASIVRQILKDYPDQIQSLQQGSTVFLLWLFAKMYEAVGLLAERDRCLEHIMSTTPQTLWEWVHWLSVIERLGNKEQKQVAIAQTTTWLQHNQEDHHVRYQYLALIAICGTAQHKQEAIADTATWLQLHPDNSSVRTKYLGLIERYGTAQDKQQAIANTATWLQLHPDDWDVRTKYLGLIERNGTAQDKQEAIANTATWLQLHPDDWDVRTKYLGLIEKCGTAQDKQEVIAQTATWLKLHPNDTTVRTKYLGLIERYGTAQDKQEAIAQTTTWLQLHPEAYDVRTKYLALIGQCGKPEQQQEAIADTATWLQLHPDDREVRTQYLVLIRQSREEQKKQQAIAETATWLQQHPDDTTVRTQYLALIGQCGNEQQQQEAISKTTSWLKDNPNYSDVRTTYLSLTGKAGQQKIIDVEPIINQQWQWLSQQQIVDETLWSAFLPVLYHHAQPSLIQEAINLALQQYPDTISIILLIFGYFRDYLDYETCYRLADFFKQYRLHVSKWQNYVYAANFFRDYGDLDTAEAIYRRHMIKHGNHMQKTIQFASLSYARLLVLRQPPKCNKAINYLKPILAENPKHPLAHLYIAQCYQVKGQKFYPQAINHFLKAIEFDQYKNGNFWYYFGCFQWDTMENTYEAGKCFQNSLQQKINLPACVSLAELEVKAGRFDSAREYLQQGLALVPITRPEKEQRQQLEPLIQQIQQAIQEHLGT
jgi:tetratricopeptide (TPR) repeat protein